MTALARKLTAMTASLAAAGVFSAASAQQPSAPGAEPAPVFPETCVPFEDKPGRKIHLYEEPLQTALASLRAYSGWKELEKRLIGSGAFEGICAFSRGKEGAVNIAYPRKALEINIYADSVFGPGLRDPEELAEDIKYNKEPYHAMNLVYAAVLGASSVPNYPLIKPADDAEMQVVVKTLSFTASGAEQTLYAAEHYLRTGDNKLLEVTVKELSAYEDIIGPFIKSMKDMRDKNPEARLDDATRDALRHSIATSALQNAQFRAQALQSLVEPVLQYATRGLVDPTTVLYKPYSTKAIAALALRFPGKGYETLPMVVDYKKYWVEQGDKDLARPMLQALDRARSQYQEQKSRRSRPAPNGT